MPSPTAQTPMNLQELKRKTPAELLAFAEELEIENASSLRKQDMMFAILKQLAENDVPISGDGVLEVLSGRVRLSALARGQLSAGPGRYLCQPEPGAPLWPAHRRHGRGRDPLAADGERYFALLKVNSINFDEPDRLRQRINFDNLTPLYPEEKLELEFDDPTRQAT